MFGKTSNLIIIFITIAILIASFVASFYIRETTNSTQIFGAFLNQSVGDAVVVREAEISFDQDIIDFSKTYLGSRIDEFYEFNNEKCIQISGVVDDTEQAVVLNFLTDQENINISEFFSEIKSFEDFGLSTKYICDSQDDTYIILSDFDQVQIGRWVKKYSNDYFKFFQSVPNLDKDKIFFAPHFYDDMSMILLSGKSESHEQHKYYLLNSKLLTADLVEFCMGGMYTSSSGFEKDKYYFECEREFSPKQ